MNRKRTTAVLVVAILIGCATVRDIGNRVGNVKGIPVNTLLNGAVDVGEAQVITKSEEKSIGESVAIAITNTYPVDTGPGLTRYVNQVGLTLADNSDAAGDSFVFGVLNNPTPGAYSAPGGYVFVTTGLLQMAHDESELAGVLAHEITHVAKHHGLDGVRKQRQMSAVGKTAFTALNVQQAVPLVDGGVDTVMKIGYDKGQEFDADAGAVKLLIATGYDPRGFERFLTRLDAAQAAGGGQLMSTHPGTHDRVAKVAAAIQSAGDPGGQTLADRFRANVH